jgi:hypothetical protein
MAISADGAAWTWVGAVNQLSVTALGSDEPQVTGVATETQAPRFVVRAPYPNPASAAAGATFSFSLSGPDRVRVELYDARGRLVAVRADEAVTREGAHAFRWAPRVPAGTYYVRFATSAGANAAIKWTLIR